MRCAALGSLLIASVFASSALGADTGQPAWMNLGGPLLQGWTGVGAALEGAGTVAVPGRVGFRFPDGPRGFYHHGFRIENDGTVDFKQFFGLHGEVRLADAREVDLKVTLALAHFNNPDREESSIVHVVGEGWHTVTLPWTAFAFPQAGDGFLKYGKGVTIDAAFSDGSGNGQIAIRNVRLIKATTVAIDSDVRGKSAPSGQEAEYPVRVTNCTDQRVSVALSLVKYGWESMTAMVEPDTAVLAPGETQTCRLRVNVNPRVPPGGHERQVLQAIANGDGSTASEVSFVTTCELPHPYILHTSARWDAVRDKVKKYAWAKAAQDAYLATAENWVVPEVAKPPHNDPDDNSGAFLFVTADESDLLACAYSWELTGDKKYAGKAATFLRRLSDPRDGYPKTYRACNQSLVQEGHFFQHVAMAYDIIRDSGVLSDADREQIDATLRLVMETFDRENQNGAINNWNLSEVTGGFYCALVVQDLSLADRFFSGPGGIVDQLAKGTMDDGWWYECAISYNMWCASEFTQAAIAYQPFGVNFKAMWVPASYSPSALLRAELNGGNSVESPDPQMKGRPFGMDPSIYGPILRPYRTITDLWNSMLPFIDYRGVMFGVNDSTENIVTGPRREVSGQPFELAYFAFRDPRYASLIKLGDGKRDLLYAVPELPEKTPEQYRDSAYADNVGLVMLRSQTPNRPIREQIQAVLHYGTHGWAHGHFDRTDLLSLMRYGRSFWNPESVFYVYEPFMYKFFTQTSVNHNMVVVDQKMQEATPGRRLLFHTGKLMQATAVETTARWSNPPYGGMVYDYVPVKTFAEKSWREGRYVPIPANPPAYGTMTDFTEPILQRRAMIVTDDYVLIADYVKGEKPHTFDDLLQIKGFLGLDAPGKSFLRHDAQWNTDPLGSGQFVTDCNWFSAQAPAVAHFQEQWGPGADNEGSRSIGNVDGVLKLDVHSLWPPAQQIMVATAPEQHDVEKRLYYTVRGDGKTLAEGKFGAWILGEGDVDVPLDGVKELQLETKTELSKRPTLFWAGGCVITKDGKEIPLSQLPLKFENITPAAIPNRDYLGGPVKIAGNEYSDAVPAEPMDSKSIGRVVVDLSRISALRLKAVVGSDYPPGDEAQRRKTYAIRAQGTSAVFLTIIEPYEQKPVIRSATADAADHIRVELRDGRVQEISIQNLAGDHSNITITLTESQAGSIRREGSVDRP
jgi:hypothetical protein